MHIVLNNEKETDSVILFLHIPKTAGSTLHHIFYNQYANNVYTKLNQSFKELTKQQKRRIKYIRGHFDFGLHQELPQNNHIYITLLREPVDRLISNYYFMLRAKNRRHHKALKDLTLYQYVTKEEFNFYKPSHRLSTINLQTRQLAGKNGSDDLSAAKNNLRKYFSVVGVTERFDDTLCCISNELGWKKLDNYKSKNITINRPTVKEIPNEIIEIIKRKNQKDLELYKFANRLLSKNLQQLKG